MQYLTSIDQSTTSTKFSLFNTKGKLVGQTIIEHKQYTPAQGWLEHDSIEIMTNLHKAIEQTINKAKQQLQGFDIKKIKGLGVTDQRQTLAVFSPEGKPYYKSIVWSDTRAKDICKRFSQKYGDKFKQKTGLPVSTYFSMFKILWLKENVPEIAKAIEEDKIRFGTMDTWVVYNLTGKYVTDASNASRTFLCNLKGQWDQELMAAAGLKPSMLPQIVDSFSNIATVTNGPLSGVEVRSILGDQMSSVYAHELKKNQMKISYGTGCFMLANIGPQPTIHPSFITTILFKHKGYIQYGYECAVECGGGTINWAKRTQLFDNYNQLNEYQTVLDQELYFLPSFGQIYSPFWKTGVQGGLIGVNLATSKSQIVASILESILFRVHDNISLKALDNITDIFADGGVTKNNRLMQHQSDVLNRNFTVRERDTCWGVAKGVLTSYDIKFQGFQNQAIKNFKPNQESHQKFNQKYKKWLKIRNRNYGWKEQQ